MKYILTGDWHIRETAPVCRLDNYWETQWFKIDWIAALSKKYNAPVIHSGDLFHHWKPSPYLLSMCIIHLPEQFFTVYGNHDLPQHNLQLLEKSGVNVLDESNRIKVLKGTHWEQELTEPSMIITNCDSKDKVKVAVWHVMTYKDELPYLNCKAMSAKSILKKYKDYSLILTGDNHVTFVEEFKNRILINPGSIFRWNASQINHKPCVFLYDTEDNTYQQIFIPIKKGVISRQHIENKEKINNRIDAFISGLSTDFETEISFQANLTKFFEKNRIRKNIKEIVYKFVDL